jgi:archaellum component FlaC
MLNNFQVLAEPHVVNARDKERERLLGELLHLRNQFNNQLNQIKFQGVTLEEVAADSDREMARLAQISSLEERYEVVSSKLWTLLGVVGKRNRECLAPVILGPSGEQDGIW